MPNVIGLQGKASSNLNSTATRMTKVNKINHVKDWEGVEQKHSQIQSAET